MSNSNINPSNDPIPNTPLRRERMRRGWSQSALARRAGCSLNSVSLAERMGRLTPAMAERIAGALGIDPCDLVSPGARRR